MIQVPHGWHDNAEPGKGTDVTTDVLQLTGVAQFCRVQCINHAHNDMHTHLAMQINEKMTAELEILHTFFFFIT